MDEELREALADVDRLRVEVRDLRERLDVLAARERELVAELATVRAERDQARAEVTRLRTELAAREAELAAKQAEVDDLKALVAHGQATSSTWSNLHWRYPIVSTQTQHPWRATARTVVAAMFGALSLLPTVAVTAGIDTVPAVAQVVAVAAAVTRVMALPGVDAWLRTYLPWLAPEPPAPAG